jgi:predicted Zn-dependent peptidase/outer membrane lipoprotein-sorting protein
MSTLAENVDRVLPIFADVIRRPDFDSSKVALAKNNQKSAISRRNDNPQQIGFRVFEKVLYGERSPYARTPEYYTVDRITRADVQAFHAEYFHPGNTIVSVWGDFDAEAIKEKLREQFGDWEAEDGFERPMPPEPEARRAYSVNVVPKDNVNQSTIVIGHPGEMTRRSDDYPRVTVMNQVLSGGFSSRLFQNVRKEKGLAYSVFGAYTANYTRPGAFYAGIFTKSSTTVKGAQAVMEEVERLRAEAPSQEEVDLAKDSYLNSFVFNFDTKREVLSRLMTYEYYGYPSDFLQQTKDGVETVTPDDVKQVAETYLHPDESHIVIVGKRDDFSDSLAALTRGGTVNEVDVSIPTSPPSEEAPASAESQAAGMELLQQAKQVLGGSSFQSLKGMRVASTQTVQSPQGEQTIESTLLVSLPNQLRVEQTLPNGMQITIADDGDQMMLKTPRGTQQAPPQIRKQAAGSLWRSLPYLMANLDDEDLSVQSLGAKTVDGTAYEAVKVTPPAGNPLTLYLDPDSHRPQRMDYTQMTRQGPKSQTDVYSDFQTHNGIALPHTTTTYRDGQTHATTTVQSVTINPDLTKATFQLSSAE